MSEVDLEDVSDSDLLNEAFRREIVRRYKSRINGTRENMNIGAKITLLGKYLSSKATDILRDGVADIHEGVDNVDIEVYVCLHPKTLKGKK